MTNAQELSQNAQVALPRIAMIGAGSMGSAILAGLTGPGMALDAPVQVTTRSAASAAKLNEWQNVDAYASETDPTANQRAVEDADLVILAVKPWAIHDVLSELASSLKAGATVISVAAGITIASMQALVPDEVHIVRAMPNTPSTVTLGMAGVATAADTPQQAVEQALTVFGTVGEVLHIDESQMDALGAVSGSGPAYLFWFTEQLTDAAARLGFTPEQAKLLAEQTVIGAAQLMAHSNESPAKLRENVTSPGGTTAEALKVFGAAGFDKTTDEALAAAMRRSAEIAAGKV